MRKYESQKLVLVNAVFALVITLVALFADAQAAMAQEKLWIDLHARVIDRTGKGHDDEKYQQSVQMHG